MLTQFTMLWTYMSARFVAARQKGEAGSVVETVIITAVFAALAIAIGAIIVSKITDKANSIDLN